MMVRTQIMLDTESHRRAKQRAAELGISLAEYVRRAIDRDLGEQRPTGDISEIFDLFDSGGSDVARYKDDYIGEAIEAEWRRETGRDEAD